MKQVEIRIKGEKQTLKTEGFSGDECMLATAGIRERLGGEVVNEEPTPEMFIQEEELESAQ